MNHKHNYGDRSPVLVLEMLQAPSLLVPCFWLRYSLEGKPLSLAEHRKPALPGHWCQAQGRETQASFIHPLDTVHRPYPHAYRHAKTVSLTSCDIPTSARGKGNDRGHCSVLHVQWIASLKKINKFAEGFPIILGLKELHSGVCKQAPHQLLLRVIYLSWKLTAQSALMNLTVVMKTSSSVIADEKGEMLILWGKGLSIYIWQHTFINNTDNTSRHSNALTM